MHTKKKQKNGKKNAARVKLVRRGALRRGPALAFTLT